MTPFLDHKDGEGIVLNPRSILRMRVERTKVPLAELRFESKSQTNKSFDNWVTWVLSASSISKMMNKVGIMNGLTIAGTISINRKHGDLKLMFF